MGITLGDYDGITLGHEEVTYFNESNDGKLEDTLLGHTLETDYELGFGYLYGDFDDNNDGNIDGSTLSVSLGSTDASSLCSNEGMKLGSSDDEVPGITLVYYYLITRGIY